MRTVESIHVAAMGTDAHVVVVDGPLGLIRHATARLAELERRWSRFVATSDVARCNERSGQAVTVHPDTVRLVHHAATAWRASDGRFDPTVHDALVELGYDRPFAQLAASVPAPSVERRSPGVARPAPGCAGIVLDLDASVVRLPAGVRFDAGGVGKGLAADLIVDELLALGAAGALVNIGGDLRATGEAPDGEAWTVDVEHPFDTARRIGRLAFASGQDLAVATSSTLGRRWTRDGEVVHHLVDPATGRPHDGPHVAVTVVGTRAATTDVAAKVLLDGRAWPAGLGPEPPSLRVEAGGRIERRAGIDRLFHVDPDLAGTTRIDEPAATPSDDARTTEEVPACSLR